MRFAEDGWRIQDNGKLARRVRNLTCMHCVFFERTGGICRLGSVLQSCIGDIVPNKPGFSDGWCYE